MSDQEAKHLGWTERRLRSAAIIIGCLGLAWILNQFAPGPSSEDAYERGSTALDERKYGEAREAFDKVISLDPNNASAHFQRARALRQLDQTDAAKADYDTAIRLAPDDPAAHYNRGLILVDQNKADEALADFDAVVRLSPQDPDPHLRRAEIFRALGDFDHALAERTTLIEMRKRRSEDYLARSALHRDFGDLDAAIADLDTAIGGAGSYEAFFNRGLLKRAKGDIDGAMADFSQAGLLKPDDMRTDMARAETLLAAGRIDAAKAIFDDMIKRNAEGSPPYALRGALTLFVLGDVNAGAADLDTAVKKSFDYREYSRLMNAGFQSIETKYKITDPSPAWTPEVAANVSFYPTILYYCAWWQLARLRAGKNDNDDFQVTAGRLGASSWTEAKLAPPERSLSRPTWPAPVLALLDNKVTPDVVRRAAEAEPAPGLRRREICEVDFFLAEYSLHNKNLAADTQKLFQSAIDGCPPGSPEVTFAKAELKRLASPHE